MATIKAAMDRAARGCSTNPPSSWTTATSFAFMELKDFLYETAEELLDRVDWPPNIGATATISGTGATTYSLPSDFKRLMRDEMAVFETTNTRRACVPVPQDGTWEYLNEVGSAGAFRYFRVEGDEESGFTIDFFRALDSGEEIKVQYVKDRWLKTSGNDAKVWTTEDDTLLLPQRLIELGVVWRFRRRKGIGYQDIYSEYEMRLARFANDYRNRRKITFGDPGEPVHPMRVPVPDFIPSS